ncbi:MAG: PIN domain-containing protein [Myxococcales bacterium]|nr:PIN domain-containing protein [Myxococcales bacterium]
MLDAGALIAFERNDRKVRTLIEIAISTGAPLHVPGAVVAQVWRDGSRQVRLARLIGSGLVRVQPLDREEAQATGVLCGKAGVRDVVDASVALLARRHGATVVTRDPEDLARIDAGLTLVSC